MLTYLQRLIGQRLIGQQLIRPWGRRGAVGPRAIPGGRRWRTVLALLLSSLVAIACHQPLTALTSQQIATGVDPMRHQAPTAFANERLVAAQELYRWLIQPIHPALAAQPI